MLKYQIMGGFVCYVCLKHVKEDVEHSFINMIDPSIPCLKLGGGHKDIPRRETIMEFT